MYNPTNGARGNDKKGQTMTQLIEGAFFEQISAAFRENDPDVLTKQRESDHVRCVQLLYHAIARGAFAESLELVTDDFVLEICGPPQSPFNGKWQGRTDVLAAMQRNFGMLEDQRPVVQSVVAQGDMVIITAHEEGRVRTTGKTYQVQWMQEFTFAGGRVKKVRELVDGGADFELDP